MHVCGKSSYISYSRDLESRLKQAEREGRDIQAKSFTTIVSSNLMLACPDANFLQRGTVPKDLRAKERERVGLYRQKTKAALVIQLAWRRYQRRKKHRLALEAQTRVIQVSVCM